MNDTVRQMLIAAVEAGNFGATPPGHVAEAIAAGDGNISLDSLGFDSLGWMEFCIAIELQSGLELSTSDVASMTRLIEVEDWIRERL
jgi:acyl carrier protein